MTTFKVLYFDGSEISRYMMNQPMAKDYQFRGIFCRRKNVQTHAFKYYLYTEDMETMIIAAEKKKAVRQYLISMNANQMTKESKFYMGGAAFLKKSDNFAFSWHPQIDTSTRLMLYFNSQTSQHSQDIFIPKLGTSLLLRDGKSLDQIELQNQCLQLRGTTQADDQKDSTTHYIIFQDENQVMDLYQTYEDEFSITISYPFSIFQAFSMALYYAP